MLQDPNERERQRQAEETLKELGAWLPIFFLAVLTAILLALGADVQAGRVCSYLPTPAPQQSPDPPLVLGVPGT